MEEWMKQPVSYLKRLVKSRAGRVAELQMEIKILEGIIDKKVSEGDLGGSPRKAPSAKPNPPAQTPESGIESAGEPAKDGASGEAIESEIPEARVTEKETEQTKISQKSSSHAFKEID